MTMSFKKYLIKQNLAPSTMKSYLIFERSLSLYFSNENKSIKELSYNDLLGYFDYKQKGQLKRGTLSQLLTRIQRYYDYLGVENPLQDFKLKGYDSTYIPQLLTASQMKQIAVCHHQNKRLGLVSKVAIGLLVYQGLSTRELANLQVANINLEQAEISISNSRLNERTIPLQATQILDLMQLVQGKKSSASLLDYQGERHLQNRHTHWKEQIHRELKKHGLKIPFMTLRQLRASRIALWIKDLGLLHAQYLAGHQQLSSTQRYETQEHEQLRATFKQIHPMF